MTLQSTMVIDGITSTDVNVLAVSLRAPVQPDGAIRFADYRVAPGFRGPHSTPTYCDALVQDRPGGVEIHATFRESLLTVMFEYLYLGMALLFIPLCVVDGPARIPFAILGGMGAAAGVLAVAVRRRVFNNCAAALEVELRQVLTTTAHTARTSDGHTDRGATSPD